MKREIKFRGKAIHSGEWVFGYYSVNDAGESFIQNSEGAWEVDEETVGEFTGLKDKNGVDVFEGDIVEAYNEAALDSDWGLERIHRGVIEYYENAFCLVCGDIALDKWICAEVIEVIGSIHDNQKGGENEA